MRSFSRLIPLLAIPLSLACSGSTEPTPQPKTASLPLLIGSYTFQGAYGLKDCLAFNNGVCIDSIWRWVGHTNGQLTFGDTIPGTLLRGDDAGRYDVTVTGTLSAEYIYNPQGVHTACDASDWSCWPPYFAPKAMAVLPPARATVKFSGGAVTEVDFEVAVVPAVPNEGRPSVMRFFLLSATQGFAASTQPFTAAMQRQ